MWWRKNQPDIYQRTWKFLCYEDFVFYKLGLEPTMDYSMAARTMAFDIKEKKWSKEMLEAAAAKLLNLEVGLVLLTLGRNEVYFNGPKAPANLPFGPPQYQ